MYYFIQNPTSHSGRVKSTWETVQRILVQKQISYKLFNTQYRGHARELAEKISTEDPYATIAAVGGDGTVHEIINGLTHLDTVTFGVIPSGSGNDFARGMNISNDTETALNAILNPTLVLNTDLGLIECDGHTSRFGISAGLGFDAAVCHEALSSTIKNTLNRVGLGNLTYAAIATKQLIMYKPGPMSFELEGERKIHYKRVYFACFMNTRYEGGGMKMTPSARPDDGIINIMVVDDIPKAKITAVLPLAYGGKHIHLKGVHFIRCKKATILADTDRPVHLDGESGGFRRELKLDVLPGALRVIIK